MKCQESKEGCHGCKVSSYDVKSDAAAAVEEVYPLPQRVIPSARNSVVSAGKTITFPPPRYMNKNAQTKVRSSCLKIRKATTKATSNNNNSNSNSNNNNNNNNDNDNNNNNNKARTKTRLYSLCSALLGAISHLPLMSIAAPPRRCRRPCVVFVLSGQPRDGTRLWRGNRAPEARQDEQEPLLRRFPPPRQPRGRAGSLLQHLRQ